MAEDRTLDVRAVAERFAQSAQVLDGLEERLSSLSATSHTLGSANQSLQQSATSIQGFTKELSEMMVQLRKSAEELRIASSSAEKFLAQTDTAAIASGLEEIRSILVNQVEALTKEKDGMQEQLTALESEVKALTVEVGGYKSKISSVPEKVRRKFGL